MPWAKVTNVRGAARSGGAPTATDAAKRKRARPRGPSPPRPREVDLPCSLLGRVGHTSVPDGGPRRVVVGYDAPQRGQPHHNPVTAYPAPAANSSSASEPLPLSSHIAASEAAPTPRPWHAFASASRWPSAPREWIGRSEEDGGAPDTCRHDEERHQPPNVAGKVPARCLQPRPQATLPAGWIRSAVQPRFPTRACIRSGLRRL